MSTASSSLSLPAPSAPSPGESSFGPSSSSQQQQQQQQLTSTTAPGKVFPSRYDLAEHYRSDWHRYNLRRREAGLHMLNEHDFTSRLDAATALRREKEIREIRDGNGHRKDKTDRAATTTRRSGGEGKGKKTKKKKDRGRRPAFAPAERGSGTSGGVVYDAEGGDEDNAANDETMMEEEEYEDEEEDEEEEEGPPEIDPCQSPFDERVSSTPIANLSYVKSKYSFYLPDVEYLVDLEGFLGYCNEKVRWGNVCLYCQRTFRTGKSTMRHMVDKRHCKILYERGTDMEEYDVFYDFARMTTTATKTKTTKTTGARGEDDDDDEVGGVGGVLMRKAIARRVVGRDATMDEDEDEEEWEDVSEDDDDDDDAAMDDAGGEDDGDDEDDLYDAYEREINTRGIDITPLGELIFPDGRIVGHRGLARYYRQRYAPDGMERAAVRHAREAAGDRLYNGRVVNVSSGGRRMGRGSGISDASLTTTSSSGRRRGSYGMSMAVPPSGRDGGGILVSTTEGGGGADHHRHHRHRGGDGHNNDRGFTSLSLYRYRAAIKKQRREDDRGRRLQHRSRMNMNKMNKKGNNIATGVVTSHMPR